MIPRIRPLVFAGFAGLAVTAAGCGGVGHGWGVGGGSVVKTEGGETLEYTLDRLTCDGRTFLVLTANGCKGTGSSGGSGDFRGQLHTTDGREVAWSCKTPDGKSGTVVVDGATFDLAKGGVFLVSTKERPARTEQVTVPADRLQVVTSTDGLPELAKDEPRVAAFLAACRTRP